IVQQRAEELETFRRGLEQLDDFLSGEVCRSLVLARLYAVDPSQRVCGGCNWCRSHGREPISCPPLAFPAAKPPAGAPTSDMVDACPSPLHVASRERFLELIHRCVVEKRLRRFFCAERWFSSVMTCFQEAFPPNTPAKYRLDPLSKDTTIGVFDD